MSTAFIILILLVISFVFVWFLFSKDREYYILFNSALKNIDENNIVAAETALSSALEKIRNLPKSDPRFIYIDLECARIAFMKNEIERAIGIYKDVLLRVDPKKRTSIFIYARIQLNLAEAYEKANHIDYAEFYYKETLSYREKMFGSNSKETLLAVIKLSQFFEINNRIEEAEVLLGKYKK